MATESKNDQDEAGREEKSSKPKVSEKQAQADVEKKEEKGRKAEAGQPSKEDADLEKAKKIREALAKSQEKGEKETGMEKVSWRELEERYRETSVKLPKLKDGEKLDEGLLQEIQEKAEEHHQIAREMRRRTEGASVVLDPLVNQMRVIEDLHKQGEHDEAEDKLEALEGKVEQLTERETSSGEKDAGLAQSFVETEALKIRREHAGKGASEINQQLLEEMGQAPTIWDHETAQRLSQLAGMQRGRMGWGMVDAPPERTAGESKENHERAVRLWALDKISNIDRVEISPNDLVYFREWNDLLQSLPQLPDDIRGQVSAWKGIYIAGQTYDASMGADQMGAVGVGIEDAFKFTLGGKSRENVSDDFSKMAVTALAYLQENAEEYMRPAMKYEDPREKYGDPENPGQEIKGLGQTPAERRQAIKDYIVKRIVTEMKGQDKEVSQKIAKLALREAERIWALSGLKAQADRVIAVTTKDKGGRVIEGNEGEAKLIRDEEGRWKIARDEKGFAIAEKRWKFGRDPRIDAEILKFGGVRNHEVYKFSGEGRFWDRRISGETKDVLATEKNILSLPSMWNWLIYDDAPKPKDFFSARRIAIKHDREGKFDTAAFVRSVQETRWEDMRGLWGVWMDTKRKIIDTRKVLLDSKVGFLRNPSIANLEVLLEKGLENFDAQTRDAVPRFLRGYYETHKKRGTFEGLIPRLETVEREETIVKPDGTTEKRKYKTRHWRTHQSEIGQVTSTGAGMSRWDLEKTIDYLRKNGRIDAFEAEKMKREMLGFDFGGFELFGLWKKKKVRDQMTGQEYYVSRIPGFGPVRWAVRFMENTLPKFAGALGGGIFEMIKQFIAELGLTASGGGGGGKKR